MRRIFGLFVGMCSILPALAQDNECNPTAFRVTYTCGTGTLASGQVLPQSRYADYGQDFESSAFARELCTPPSGYVFGGVGIFVDGVQVATYSNVDGFTFQYNYASDITIAPSWVPVATSIMFEANLGADAIWFANNAELGTFRVAFPYGVVYGVGHCSSVKPNWINYSTAGTVGYIAVNQQNLITNDTGGGMYCYCKMTEPYYSKSRWVFRMVTAGADACANDCPGTCAWRISNSAVFRASIFAGAMAN